MLKIKYVTISSIVGILIGYYIKRCDLIISLLFCIICLIIYFLSRKNIIINKYMNKVFFIYLIIIILFVFYSNYRYSKFNNKLIKYVDTNDKNIAIGKIINFEKETEYYNVYNFRLLYINNDKIKGNICVYLPKIINYQKGDYLKCNLEIELPNQSKNDGGFDNKLYLFSNNIYAYGYSKDVQIINKNTNKILMFIDSYKKECIKNINNKLDKDVAGVLISILFANKSYISSQIKEDFSNANLSHILNVSGSTITYIITFLTLFTNQISAKKRNIIITIFLIIYLPFFDLSISLLRFIIIYLIGYIYKISRQKISNIDTVFLGLLIFLIYNPLILFNSSVIFSFLCVFSMKLLYKRINYRMQYVFNQKNNRKVKNIINIISMTISIYIITFPVVTIYFNKVYILSLFSNILSVFFINLIIPFSFIYLFIYKVPILSNLILFIISVCIQILIIIAKFFSFIPLSNFLMFPFNLTELILYYFTIYTNYINNRVYLKIKTLIQTFIVKYQRLFLVFVAILCLIFSFLKIYNFELLKINFIDVEQGDCSLIRINNKVILIDGGGNASDFDIGQRVLVPYLLNKRIFAIDYIIVSHFDTDHCRGLISVINSLNVKNIVISEFVEKSEEYHYFFNNIKNKNINIIKAKVGESINLSEKANICFLSPWEEFYDVDNRENNLSIVCKLNYYDFSCLFTGDIDNTMEDKIINKYGEELKSDVLKVGHHGSKSSSSDEFLKYVIPNIALIGVGSNNYGHPNIDVLKRLNNIGTKIFRTDVNGEIKIVVNNKGKVSINSKIK